MDRDTRARVAKAMWLVVPRVGMSSCPGRCLAVMAHNNVHKSLRQRERICTLLSETRHPPEEVVTRVVCGWLRSVRFQKKRAFGQLDDGSCAAGLQLVMHEGSTTDFGGLRKLLRTGASVRVTGQLQRSPGAGQALEIQAEHVELIGRSDESYPLQKKWHSPEFLRGLAHLRPRTRGGNAVARVRSAMALSTHSFFEKRGFLSVHTPILTSCDAEVRAMLTTKCFAH